MSGLRYQELLLMEEIRLTSGFIPLFTRFYIYYIYPRWLAGFLPSPALNLKLSWFSMDPTHQFSLVSFEKTNTWNVTCSAARNLKNNMGRKNIKINQRHLQSINQFWVLHLISVMKFMMETICFFSGKIWGRFAGRRPKKKSQCFENYQHPFTLR